MANTRPSFRDAMRSSTAAARDIAAQSLGAGKDPAKLFEAADEIMGQGGLTSPIAERPGAAPLAGAPRPVLGSENEQDVIFNVPLDKVHDNDFNARVFYSPEVIRQRAAEIAMDGQKTPALAVPHPTLHGEFMLIEGHYRKRALLHLGRPTIKLTLRRDWTTPEQRYVQSWKANEERLANSPLDNALQWRKVIDTGVVPSQDDLASLLGVSKATVAKVLALNALPPAAVARAQENAEVFTASLLYELSLYGKESSEESLLKLMEEVATEGLGRRAIAERRERLKNPPHRKQREESRRYKVKLDYVEDGMLKESDEGLIQLTLRIKDPAAAKKVVGDLKGMFNVEPDVPGTTP